MDSEEDDKVEGLPNPTVGRNQCAYCKKEGHWQANCHSE